MLAAPSKSTVREELLFRIQQARRLSDELFAVVRPEALYDRPIPERHRIIFYLGHLEAFDWNLLHQRLFHLSPFDPQSDRLFAFGIDPVGGGLPADKASDWPTEKRVREYVGRVRDTLDEAIESLPFSGNETDEFPAELLLNVAIEHRLMHAETLAYMLHQLPLNRKVLQSRRAELHTPAVTPGMVEIAAGSATLGLRRAQGEFGWDNEFEAHEVSVPAFAIDRFPITNAQFLEFLQAGGYENRSLWDEADWEWRESENITHPAFWLRRADEWLFRGMFGEVPLPLDWPVYVSHAEAAAFARWVGKRLPTEAQWHRAAYGSPDGAERDYPWGHNAPAPAPAYGNFDFASWNPTPVNAFPEGKSAWGVSDLLGNGWEWTSTVFGPFSGFEPFSFYRGYSADFFDGKHFVLKGGSARTAACMMRRSFRNWFQGHYQYVYAGFRCVSQ